MAGRRNSLFRSFRRVEALDRRDLPSAALPFSDGFESGDLGPNWGQSATNNGAVSVSGSFSPIAGGKHVLVGPTASGINSRSELILHVDLAGAKNAVLNFKQKEFNDLDHAMPLMFTGTSNTDGVALSVDGTNWYRIVSLTGSASQNTTQQFSYNLGKIAANNGLSLTSDTQIKFQNFGSAAPTSGGFAFDDISVSISGTIDGRVFQDANADGIYQAGETGTPNQKVYLDANNDGKLNVGLQTAVFTEHLPAPIVDTTRSLYPLRVYNSGEPLVDDVDVSIALAHTYDADLDIYIISPDGRRVELTTDNGSSGDHYYITTFDDSAATSITAGVAPFSGTFRPEGKLSDLKGAPVDGWWYLEIVDDQAGDTGTLGAWSLDFTHTYTKTFNEPLLETEVNYFDIPVTYDSYYQDMDVVVNIDHPNVGDLSLLVADPSNHWVYLSENNGGTGNNYTNTRFDDEAATSILAGSPPYTGRYRPEGKISSLQEVGVVFSYYQVRVSDDVPGNLGTMKSASIILSKSWTAGGIDPILAGNPNYGDRYAEFTVPNWLGQIVDADVLVHIDHSNNEVLNLELQHVASSTIVDLTSGNSLQGGSGDNFHNTLFDDEADRLIIADTGPYSAAFRSYQSLSKFDGLSAGGDWKLKIDNTKVASGQLNWGALVFYTTETETDLTVRSIPDQSTITESLTVSGIVGSLADLDVRLNIIHSFDADLDVYLTAPNGRTVQLFTDVGSTGDNFSGTVLDDEALTSITAGTAPFAGSYRPEGSLADFDGIDPNGTWTLTITDDAQNDTGLLTGWSLLTTTGERFDVTDANGNYSFENVAPGLLTVRTGLKHGVLWTSPTSGKYVETMTYDGTLSGRDFGYQTDTSAPHADFAEIDPFYRNTSVPSVTLVFSEAVTGVDIADFTLYKGNDIISLAGATISTLDGITWTIGNLAGLNTTHGSYHIALNSVGSGIMDLAGNPMASFTNPTEYWFLDLNPLMIYSLTREGAAVTTQSIVSWKYDFLEIPYGLSLSNFELSGSAAANAKLINIVGDYVYAQTFDNGDLTLTLANSIGLTDGAGNKVANVPFTGETYTIDRPLTHVSSVKVNDGNLQRSRVTQLTVNFDFAPVFLTTPTAAFELKRKSDGAIVSLNAVQNSSAVTITFTGGPLEFGSLVDGRYTLTTLGTQVANFDGNGDGTIGDPFAFEFHRLFGDADGNASVNTADFNAFRLAFAALSTTFDFDGDGVCGTTDFNQFRVRFGSSV